MRRTDRRPGQPAERHAADIAALQRAVFESEGVTNRAARAAAARENAAATPMSAYLAQVRRSSYRVTDGDITDLREAGHSEEEIFELTVAAGLGAALRSRDDALRTLQGDA